ncbi:MAG TPA: glutamine amidotransferase [Polyangia bacterium]
MLDLLGDGGFNEWRLMFLSPFGRTLLLCALGLCLLALGLTWRGYRRERRLGRRLLLTLLRGGAFGCAFVLLAQPAIQLRHVTRIPNHVAVLVDDSQSMGLAERAGGPTRAARAAELLKRSRSALDALGKDHRLDYYRFSETLAPATLAELTAPAPPKGAGTRLREALALVRGRHAGRDLAGIVVISDGADNGLFGSAGLDAPNRDFVRALDTPVHTVWTGRAGLKDIAIAGVKADEFAFVHVAVTVEALLKVEGFEGRELTVTLRRDGEVLRTRTVIADQAGTVTVPFEFTPDRLGKFVYTLETPVLEGEAVRDNNVRHFVLNVIRDKVRVLQVSGRPSYDERFLRAMLKRDPNVDLISFFILRTPSDVTLVPNDELSLIPFPTEELFERELKSFDVIILQNFTYRPYGMAPYLARIKSFVEEGGALAMIGGDLSFSSGGYAGSPVADVLPIELLPEEADATRLLNVDPFRPRLTAAGRNHPITAIKLDVRENEARWNALPLLEGVNRVGPAKPGATVLATHPFLTTDNGQPMPVLVAGGAGQGRSLVFTTDTSWHWSFLAAGQGGAAAQAGDDGRTFVKFWDNAIRWLIRDPALRYLRVDTDKAEYEHGQTARLGVRAWLPDYRPARDLPVTLTVTPLKPPGAAPAAPALSTASRTDAEGEVKVEFVPPQPGAYRVVARATLSGRPVTDENVFVVALAGRELGDPAAREDTLRAVAKASGGRYLGEITTLPALPMHPPRVVRIGKHRDIELWSRWFMLPMALGLLTIEWVLRRRWGYI